VDDSPDIPVPALRLTDYLGAMIEVASVGPVGEVLRTPIPCRRRPGRRPCPGRIELRVAEVPEQIDWECPACREGGTIHRWKASAWNLSAASSPPVPAPADVRLQLGEPAYQAIRALRPLLSPCALRALASARLDAGQVTIATGRDDLDELADHVAAEANHAANVRRRRQLEDVLAVLEAALQEARG
jgi:hypothetical protein